MIEGRQKKESTVWCVQTSTAVWCTLVACVRYRYVQVANKKII